MNTGTIYLLHFSPPYKHARHYLGFTTMTAEQRIAQHVKGQGSPLIKAALAAGCHVTLVKTWPGDRNEERRMKNMGSSVRHCPLCRAPYMAALNEKRRRARAISMNSDGLCAVQCAVGRVSTRT